MNKTVEIKKKNKNLTYLIFPICIFLLLYFKREVKEGIFEGFLLSYTTVIPAVFPFFILSDLWNKSNSSYKEGIISRLFEKTFLLNRLSLPAFICGYICGFPMGVKIANNLYVRGVLTKEELEKICPLINNPSIIFVISGVGFGLFNSMKIGIILYLSVVFSSIIICFLLREKGAAYLNSNVILKQKYTLTESIKNAGLNSIYITSYIIFFSAILSIISSIVKNQVILTAIYTLSEISNSVFAINNLDYLDVGVKISLISFSLGFSGLCVFLQAFSFLPKEISKIKYLIIKLFQGLLSSILTCIFLALK